MKSLFTLVILASMLGLPTHAELVDPNLSVGDALRSALYVSPGQPFASDIVKTQNSFGLFFDFNLNYRELIPGGKDSYCYFTFLDSRYSAKEVATFITGVDGKDFQKIKWLADDPYFPNSPNYFKASATIKPGVKFEVKDIHSYSVERKKCLKDHYDWYKEMRICDEYGEVVSRIFVTYWKMLVAGQDRMGFTGSCSLTTADLTRTEMTVREMNKLTQDLFQFESAK